MLTDRRLSCLVDPAALVATQVNTPASAGCEEGPEPIQKVTDAPQSGGTERMRRPTSALSMISSPERRTVYLPGRLGTGVPFFSQEILGSGEP